MSLYESRCSCGQWSFTGTPAEIAGATKTLDGSHRGHVMAITHGTGADRTPQEFAAAVLADIAELDQ